MLDIAAFGSLLDRFSYLSRGAPSSGLILLVMISRLPSVLLGESGVTLDTVASIAAVNAVLGHLNLRQAIGDGHLKPEDFAVKAADINEDLPEIDEDVELDL